MFQNLKCDGKIKRIMWPDMQQNVQSCFARHIAEHIDALACK